MAACNSTAAVASESEEGSEVGSDSDNTDTTIIKPLTSAVAPSDVSELCVLYYVEWDPFIRTP